jgi:hypothetical protein
MHIRIRHIFISMSQTDASEAGGVCLAGEDRIVSARHDCRHYLIAGSGLVPIPSAG